MLTKLLVLLFLLPLSQTRRLNTRSVCESQPVYICVLTATPGNDITGKITFSPFYNPESLRKCQLSVKASVSGLSAGEHGFHIHTYGDESSPDATSAGGHFTNSRGDELPHGYPDARRGRRHWGDLGNITAGRDGFASYERVDSVARYRSVLGRSIVIHEGPDMGPEEQPSGASGARVASCVIGFANPDLLE